MMDYEAGLRPCGPLFFEPENISSNSIIGGREMYN